MNTLVIHIDDFTTDFLCEIYEGKGWDVLNHELDSKEEMRLLVDSYDRIVMLGHGSPSGLFGHLGYIIDGSFADILRTKECICIWCNADKFVEKHKLTGFYTGMFISEIQEAEAMGIFNSSEKEIEESNYMFAWLMNDYIFHENMMQEMKYHYQLDNDPIYAYNNERLYEK